jgi:glycosyltransferase involved in cell wall biosynthesis
VLGGAFPSNKAVSTRVSSLIASARREGYSVSVICPISINLRGSPSYHDIQQCTVMRILPIIPFTHVLSNVVNIVSSFLICLVWLIGSWDLVMLSVSPYETAVGCHLALLLHRTVLNKRTHVLYDYRDDVLDESVHKDQYRGIYGIDKYLLRLLLRLTFTLLIQSEAVVCVVEPHRRLLISRGFDSQRIHVVSNGVDTKLFRPVSEEERNLLRLKYSLPLESCVLVAVSGAGWLYYRLEPIIAALKLLEHIGEIHLLVVGRRTRELGACLGFADKMRLRARIIILGEIPHRRLPEIFNMQISD